MATNINFTSCPECWNSSNDDVVFGFQFKSNNIVSIINGGGSILVTISGLFDMAPAIGGLVRLNGTTLYDGEFSVLDLDVYSSPSITVIKVNTAYISAIGAVGTIQNMRMPSFSIYKGYKPAELYPSNLPYTLLVENFTPTRFDDLININCAGIVKAMFEPTPSFSSGLIQNNIDFSCFNVLRLVYDGEETYYFNNVITGLNHILYSTLTTKELNEKYLDGEKYLSPTYLPIVSSSGYSFATKFVDKYPTTHKFLNGIKL